MEYNRSLFYTQQPVGIDTPQQITSEAVEQPAAISTPTYSREALVNSTFNLQPLNNLGAGRPSPNDREYAAKMRAWLYQQQYDDYQQRFEPIEANFIDETMGARLLDERLARISVNSDRASAVAGENAAIRRQRYGISLSPEEQSAEDRKMQLSQTMAKTDAMNNARTHTYDRNMDSIFGSSGARQQLAEI